MPEGKIKKVLPEKGFGFIAGGGDDLFFHHSELRGVTIEELSEYLKMDEEKVLELRTYSKILIVDSDSQYNKDVSAEIKELKNLASPDKSPLDTALNSEIRDLAIECLGTLNAELLLAYQDYGTRYFQDLYFFFYRKRLREATARKRAERLKRKLKEFIRKKNRLCALRGDYGFQTARSR